MEIREHQNMYVNLRPIDALEQRRSRIATTTRVLDVKARFVRV